MSSRVAPECIRPLIVGMMQKVQGRSQPSEILRYALGWPRSGRPPSGMSNVAEDAPTVVLGKAEELLRAAPVRPAGLRIHRPDTGAGENLAPPAVPLSQTDPETLFAAAFEDRNGFAPEPRHIAAFRDAAGEV